MDVAVQATALVYFRRFYLHHSIIDHDPKLILYVSQKRELGRNNRTRFLMRCS
ncbi:hypothetical protein BDK51DRAFT_41302 [Blyttiomyces helicus]|uniref:Uncharacterized protein n=1 Tax=Blyttiomyces helicus TaxID=388810 RepID=A0A4P9VZ93_9FUNG|nr:hypothetical protein BDK51DRAFT_41302 [Blyttiomyces helicus]|eukprot:RKO85084.1 hypothetical protein BDK51DRAFT_41302 [Blyttiomyces helicus]